MCCVVKMVFLLRDKHSKVVIDKCAESQTFNRLAISLV
jgi:hypothetical protein